MALAARCGHLALLREIGEKDPAMLQEKDEYEWTLGIPILATLDTSVKVKRRLAEQRAKSV